MRAGVALDNQPRLAPGAVIPKLGMLTERVVADVNVSVEGIDRVEAIRIGAHRLGIAEITELAQVACAAMGAGNTHGRSVQVRLRTREALVDDIHAGEAVDRKRGGGRMRLVARKQMSEAKTGTGRCFEAAVAPAGIEIEAVY